MSRIKSLLPAAIATALLASASIASAQTYSSDPSNRVARLAYSTGSVEFAPAGENNWGSADINRPLTTGDRLYTGDNGRAALELGDAALRIDDNSAFNLLQLNDNTAQVELTQGTLNLRVRRASPDQTYEIDTPTVAFVANQPGSYRVDVDPDGNGAMVTVFDGAGSVYGQDGASRPVQGGQSYRFNDSALQNVDVSGLPEPDAFDQFAQSRDTRYTHSISSRYVSPETIGYDDLDQYGAWQPSSDYGQVWYPNNVSSDWVPYRDGHWAWVDPWGWTWIDNEPWGFAPYHYGRWARVNDRWGWIPGQRVERPVYAPALVAFVGGSGLSVSLSIGGGGYNDYNQPIGWFPLGPRDVYVPPYRASRGYFDNVNETNIRTAYINKTVINNYYQGYAANRPYAGPTQFAFRNDPRAFTVVPRNVFANARPIMPAVLRVKPGAMTKLTVASIPHIAPIPASLAIRAPAHPIAAPNVKAFQRAVVARHAPPPAPVPFAAREKLISQRGGAPLPMSQLHDMRQARAQAAPQPDRVKLVAAKPAAPKALPPMKPVQPMRAGKPSEPIANGPHGMPVPPMPMAPNDKGNQKVPRGPMTPPGAQVPPRFANSIHPIPANPHKAKITPIQVPVNPAASANPAAAAPMRPGELPSARFAHPQRAAKENAGAAREQAQQAQAAQAQQRDAQMKAQQAQRNAAAAATEAKQRDAQKQAAETAGKAAQARAQADRQQAQQALQRAAAQHDVQARAAQAKQAQDASARAQQAQERAQTAQSEARARADQQQQAQARQRDQQQRAQQAQQQAQAAQQRAAQAQQAREASQQRAQQARAQAQQQQAAAEQRAQAQQRAQQAQQAQQARAQQEQQRVQQAQQAQQRAAEAQQARAQQVQQQQRAQQAQQPAPQAQPTQPRADQKKRKNPNDQSDNGH